MLLLIPWIGTRDTMLVFATVLGSVSAAGRGRRLAAGAPLLIMAGLAIPQGAIKPAPGNIYEAESPYHYIQVVQKPDGARYLKLNEGWAVHSVFKPGQVMTGGYWDYFSLAPWFGGDSPPAQALVIGSAAGTIPGQLLCFYPEMHVDGVEIPLRTGRRPVGPPGRVEKMPVLFVGRF